MQLNKMERFNNSKTCLNCEDENAIQLNNFTKQILVFYPWFMVILIIFGNLDQITYLLEKFKPLFIYFLINHD